MTELWKDDESRRPSHFNHPHPHQTPPPPPLPQRSVQAHIDAGSDPARPRGAVRQALSAALQRELTEFYGFLAGLEQQLQHALPAPGARGALLWRGVQGALAVPSAARGKQGGKKL
jgi:hypothetical protein